MNLAVARWYQDEMGWLGGAGINTGTLLSAHVSVNLKLLQKIESINFSKNVIRTLWHLHQTQRKKCQVEMGVTGAGVASVSLPNGHQLPSTSRASLAFLLAVGCHSTELDKWPQATTAWKGHRHVPVRTACRCLLTHIP